ncbi:hypothetical protein [Lactiplantibacillus plantarum]|nr:hypothetical protein [Lactiplantibacillus plantarum]
MNEEDKKKEEQQRLADKKFEDFIQGIYDTNGSLSIKWTVFMKLVAS